ncbi:hypothetical protein [Psychrobacter sp.]|uniref:hypothetical protein n=1 Tax=Psychrobacter sp. TaxID=56811 RepID=UPI0025D6E524|nr:hypothetical protein [Psychrobacter sp.]
MTFLEFYFDPTLTSRQRLMCRMFWKQCQAKDYDDVAKHINRLMQSFDLPDVIEVFAILDYCYVYDNRYQCQVCRQLRRVVSPLQLNETVAKPWRCSHCLFLTN